MVTIRRNDGKVSVLNLYATPEGLAIKATDTYRPIGQVREATWVEVNPSTGHSVKKKGWGWWYDEQGYGAASGTVATKTEAVALVLEAGGYRQAPSNAANPGLGRGVFDDL